MKVKFTGNDGGICLVLVNPKKLNKLKLIHPDLEVLSDA